MKKYKSQVFILIICGLFVSVACGDVSLPAIFGDHMVLQQKSKVAVWGWAEPGEKIDVKSSWQWLGGAKTKADKNGRWQVKIKTPKASSKPVTLSIKGNNEIILDDILIGEVWVCSGQSNMQYSLAMLGDDQNLKSIEEANNSQIRLFNVVRNTAATVQDDCSGTWQVCKPETVRDFSAVGYYYGKNLQETLNIPVGLVGTNWGGTLAEAWTSLDGLEAFEQFKDALATMKNPEKQRAVYQQKLRDWENQLDAMEPGYQQGWYKPEIDDTDWKQMELPLKWSETELKNMDGVVWFRRYTTLPPSWAKIDMEIHLGPIDDIDTLWFNGVKIGSTAQWDKPRVYRIPASVLHVGKNSIAVRVIDTGSEGGIWGQEEDMRIGPVGADAKKSATLARTWKYKVSRQGGDIPSAPAEVSGDNPNRPTVLYNAMIAPLIPFRIAGAIWYQGESNCYDPILYRTLFPAMVADWRKQWGQGDFPFYFVQIAPYQYNAATCSQGIREAQLMSLSVPNTGMAVTMDIGMEKDIHPKNKADVGERLARWALTKTYKQKNIVYSGPLYKSMKIEGDKIRIAFDHADGGLVLKDVKSNDFMIAGEDKNFVPAKVVIDGDTLLVSSKAVKEPVAVRYGWSNWFMGTLFNEAGLPASSFRTDDWPLK